MKVILKLILGAFCTFTLSCSTTTPKSVLNRATAAKNIVVDRIVNQKMYVRITTYWKNGSGSDKWTRKGKSSTGIPLVDKKVAAVDPKVIPYGKTVRLNTNPPLCLKCIDTGSDVVKRTASKKTGQNHPVVDIFFQDKEEALLFANRNPYIINATFTD